MELTSPYHNIRGPAAVNPRPPSAAALQRWPGRGTV